MARINTRTQDEKFRDRYRALIDAKMSERRLKTPTLATRLAVSDRTARTKVNDPGKQTLLEMQALCGILGLGIVIYDKESEDVSVTRRIDA